MFRALGCARGSSHLGSQQVCCECLVLRDSPLGLQGSSAVSPTYPAVPHKTMAFFWAGMRAVRAPWTVGKGHRLGHRPPRWEYQLRFYLEMVARIHLVCVLMEETCGDSWGVGDNLVIHGNY